MTKLKIILAIVAIAIITALSIAASPDLQSGTQRFARLITRTLTVQNDATFQGDVSVTGDLAVTGDQTASGDLDMGNNIITNIGAAGTDFDSSGGLALDATLDVDGATTLNSTLDVDGNLSSGTGAITATDNVFIDGAADAIQLTAQGYTTQTTNLLTLEQSDGTDVFQVDNSGNTTVAGTLGATGNGTFSADLTIDDTFNLDDTVATVSGTTTITPTYSFMTVAPTVVSTLTLSAASCSDGDILIVFSTVTTQTEIVDTGATAGGGAIDLGANDLAGFICVSTTWVELFSPDNS